MHTLAYGREKERYILFRYFLYFSIFRIEKNSIYSRYSTEKSYISYIILLSAVLSVCFIINNKNWRVKKLSDPFNGFILRPRPS